MQLTTRALFFAAVACFSACSYAQSVWYVDINAAGGGGTSWADAFADLQSALIVAQHSDQIWIAGGTYTPDPTGVDETATFSIPNGVALYGGFTGVEGSITERDPAINITTLSGDIDNDDTILFVNGPNSDHVVTMDGVDSSTRLDGLEIVRGHFFSNSAGSFTTGAGLFLANGSPTIVNCRFWRNYTKQGGAVFIGAGSPTFTDCVFEGNIGSDGLGWGGAVYLIGTSHVAFTNCDFNGNEAEGINRSGLGGAIYSDDNTQLIVDHCSFGWNVALNRNNNGIEWSRGGAIYCKGDTLITHSTFTGNVSNVGGAVQSWTNVGPTRIYNCTFQNNDAISTFISGQERGGAAGTIAGGGELEIIGSVIYGGFSDNYGGAWVGAGAKVSGSIFWNNTDGNGSIGRSNIRADGPVEYCCIQGMLVGEPGEDPPDPAHFPGSISTNPQFANSLIGDFHLLQGSPCIDAADNTGIPAGVLTDLDGNARFFDDPETADTGVGPGPIVDMGAYEFGSGPSCAADFNNDGTLDFFDVSAFLAAFTSQDPQADLNGDGSFDFFDVSTFLNLFTSGCP